MAVSVVLNLLKQSNRSSWLPGEVQIQPSSFLRPIRHPSYYQGRHWRRLQTNKKRLCALAMLLGMSHCPSPRELNKNGKIATKTHHWKSYDDTIMFMRLVT
jgi:hypothetical protein